MSTTGAGSDSGESEAVGRARRLHAWRLLLVTALLLSCVAAVEVLGRYVIFRGQLYFVDDLDHRPRQGDRPGLNIHGLKTAWEPDAFRRAGRRIVMLGDSFVWGMRLPPERTLPAQVEATLRENSPDLDAAVLNAGWISASPFLHRRWLQDLGRVYAPEVVILALDMTDFHDDLKYEAIHERRRLLALLDVAPVTVMSLHRLVAGLEPLHGIHEALFAFPARRFFATDAPLAATEPRLAPLRRNLLAIARFVEEELGARFVLVVLPRAFQYEPRETPHNWEAGEYGSHPLEPLLWAETLAAEVDFPVISLLSDFQETPVFPTTFADDPHWNADGIRVAAEAIWRHCERLGCFERVGP